MTKRKKKAVSLIASGVISVTVGVVMYVTPATPPLVDVLVPIVVYAFSAFGFDIAIPETTEES